MKRAVRLTSIPVTLVMAAVVGGGLLHASAEPSPHATAELVRLEFDVRFSPFNFVDAAPPAGPSNGDMITSHDRLFRSDGTRVGHDGVSCILTNVNRTEATCTAVFDLGDHGTITAQFLNTPPPEKIGAVTGGTRHFAGADGTMRLVEHRDQTGVVTFVLED